MIEIFFNGAWHEAATFNALEFEHALGVAGSSQLQYETHYAVEYLEGGPLYQVSCRLPVNFDLHSQKRWPSFLLDILPSGAGRRVLLKRLSLSDDSSADWHLLLSGAANPPGNLRIARAVTPLSDYASRHSGFHKDDIVRRQEDFIEYAQEQGAAIDGSTDVQGVAPKFLMIQDKEGRWHPDVAGRDNRETTAFWLVKFARGRSEADLKVIRNEAPYYEVARAFGLRTGAPLEYKAGALFIPRFDRKVIVGGIERYGFESLVSAAGVSEYGARIEHLTYCRVLAQYTTRPEREIIEYIRRDILNVALRNTDNHGRNTGLLKLSNGDVELSPLYDFAPMFLDPDGIPRVTRWEGEEEPIPGRPDWRAILTSLAEDEMVAPKIDIERVRASLSQSSEQVRCLPETMSRCGVEDDLIERLSRRIDEIADDLTAIG